ncbi:3'-to-5' exoribonuclease RNase R [Lactococcus garvieae DCC43]|uniref:Ribonuclease R n=1 Tax=Lactococcus garvieae DCC43 TaxID=1231377 RepID=K2PLX7_9LACT|nr:3'-to-5' exoribonuclease RNase R [Lactococcus garvieae DCC43]
MLTEYRILSYVIIEKIDLKNRKKRMAKISDLIINTPEKNEVEGIFHKHPKGFGFVNPLDAIDKSNDIFISPKFTKSAMDGDTVIVRVLHQKNAKRGADGQIIKITKRSVTETVGSYQSLSSRQSKLTGYKGTIQLYNDKITDPLYIKQPLPEIQEGDVVRVKVTQHPDENKTFEGQMLEIIGHKDDIGIDILEVLCAMKIPQEFTPETIAQTEAIPEELTEEDFAGREDYRSEITYTIDGEDSKDLDDAIHVKKLDNGHFELGVHIADVSHYVTDGSPLDKEAFERATSVYVTDRVVPMLPVKLSNNLCSLNEAQERLTMSCVMEINNSGKIISYKIGPSVIKTTYRMTYSTVNKMLNKGQEGHRESLEQFPKIVDSVAIAGELHALLEDMRHDRGMIEFDESEAKVILDEKGHAVDVVKRERGTAERMIESFMLAANETVALDFQKKKLPSLYRVHDKPKEKAFAKLMEKAADAGFSLSSNSHEAVNYFAEEIKGTAYEKTLTYQLRHTMSTALYSEKNTQHYGLAATDYTHFTSPIRRYPDLIVHRLLHLYPADHSNRTKEEWKERLPEIAKQSSDMEHRAVVTERIVDAMKKAEYMEDHIGEVYNATVTGVQKFGLFMELENTVQGLIRTVNLHTGVEEAIEFDEEEDLFKGKKSEKTYRMGDVLKIRVLSANKRKGTVDFEELKEEE